MSLILPVLEPARRRRVLTLLAVNLFNGVTAGSVSVVLPLYAASLHATPAQIGLVGAAGSLGIILVSLPVGALVGGRFRWARLYGAGGVVHAAALLVLPFIRAPALLPLFVALKGSARTVGHVSVGSTLLGELSLLDGDKAGLHRASFALGLSLLGPLAGGLALRTVGFTSTFSALGVSVLAVAALVAIAGEPAGATRALDTHALLARRLSNLGRLLRRPHLVRAFVIEGLVNATSVALSTFMPVLVTRMLGASAAQAGAMAATQGTAYVGTLLFGGPILTRLGRRGQYAVGSALVAAGALTVALAPGSAHVFAAVVLIGSGLASISFATFSILGAEPEDKGTVFSVFGVCLSGFMLVGPALAGLIASVAGVRGLFGAFVPLFLVTGIVLGFSTVPERRTILEPELDALKNE